MTKQEFYDKICAHLVKQGCRSMGEGPLSTACLYRGANGRKCAIGAVIPDDIYTEEMDAAADTGIRYVIEEFPQLKPFIPDVRLASFLQGAHDDFVNWCDNGLSDAGKYQLQRIAVSCDLKPYNFENCGRAQAGEGD